MRRANSWSSPPSPRSELTEPGELETRRKWAYRFWGAVMGIAAWWLALNADLADPTLGTAVAVALSLGLGIGAVLLIPVDTIWVRWLVNLVVMLVPLLTALNLLIAFF